MNNLNVFLCLSAVIVLLVLTRVSRQRFATYTRTGVELTEVPDDIPATATAVDLSEQQNHTNH